MLIKLLYMFLFSIVYGIEVKHLDCEHPILTSFDPEYLTNVSMKSRRLSRSDNTHYYDFNVTLLKPLNNNLTVNILLQQQNAIFPNANLLELQYRLCDILDEKSVISKNFRDAFYRMPKEIRPMPEFKCPIRVGFYSYTKMGMFGLVLPNNFPALDGRITVALLHKYRVIIKVYGIFHIK